jgi:putative SOS response-associated peptidase YedK
MGAGMCGRFSLLSPQEAIEKKFKVSLAGFDYQPRLNIAPHQSILVVTLDQNKESIIKGMYWGFIPVWAKDFKSAHKPINARAETIQKTPYFRHAFKHGRCLIPATAFFEWEKTTKPKTPYRFHRPGDLLFAFAGLWSSWQDAEGNMLDTCAIITTHANETISWLHDRMPVILPEENWQSWFDGDLTTFKPLPKESLEFEKVSPVINNPRYEINR